MQQRKQRRERLRNKGLILQHPPATFKAVMPASGTEGKLGAGVRRGYMREQRVDEECRGESIQQVILRVVLPGFTQVSA